VNKSHFRDFAAVPAKAAERRLLPKADVEAFRAIVPGAPVRSLNKGMPRLAKRQAVVMLTAPL
jgi:hypothetical protein